jgi:citrate lyase subunit alpha/citrate CoA-transferase
VRAGSLEEAFEKAQIKDGDTLSFHHHLRNGDEVLNAVLALAAERGLQGLHIAASSLFPVHAPLVGYMRDGVVGRISSGFISGPVGTAISAGALPVPVRLQTHGGRAREVLSGALPIDVAFVAASGVTPDEGLTGQRGVSAFGAMGYPIADAQKAACVIGVADGFVAGNPDIPAAQIDHIAQVDQIGERAGIASGTTRIATDAVSQRIGALAAQVIAASGVMKNGFSFQTGAGGVSLLTAELVGQEMAQRGILGSFASGGITGQHVKMLQAGLFEKLFDVQCFDLEAVQSIATDPRHIGISAARYAAPGGGAVVDDLSCVVLGAAEVDTSFNVNVTCRADGALMGGSGGHADTADGAELTLITTRLTAAGFAKLVPQVGCVTTPGKHVDVVVTDAGIAVNPAREDLKDRLIHSGLPVVGIEDLVMQAAKGAQAAPPRPEGRIVAQGFDRHGQAGGILRQL